MAKSNKDISRRIGFRARRKKFYVFCEGKNSEPAYIDHYKSVYTKASIEVVYCMCGADPIALVKAAIKHKETVPVQDFAEGAEIWAVFDRDDHKHYNDALDRARNGGISVAISDPCFELWLALHIDFKDTCEDRFFWQGLCEKICPGYTADRKKIPDLNYLIPKVFVAEENAAKMRGFREKDGASHPITTIDMLTRCLRGAKEVPASLFLGVVIDGVAFLERTPHTDMISVDDNGILDARVLKSSIGFIQSRRASLGHIETNELHRKLGVSQANYVVSFSDFKCEIGESLELSIFPQPEKLLFFA